MRVPSPGSLLTVGISLACLALVAYLIATRGDFPTIVQTWRGIGPVQFIGAVASLIVLPNLAEAWRCRLIAAADGWGVLPLAPLIRIAWIRIFAAHGAPVAAFADAAKAAMLSLRFNLSTPVAVRLVLFERAIGAIMMMILAVAALPLQIELGVAPKFVALQGAVWLAGLLTVGAIIWLGQRPLPPGGGWIWKGVRMVMGLGSLLANKRATLLQVVAMVTQLIGMGFAIWLLARGMNLPLSVLPIAAFVAPVSFVASLPIFYNGWGGREAAMVATFGAFGGITPAQAIALSVGYGVVLLASALPGGVLWLLRPGIEKHPAVTADGAGAKP